MCSMYSYASPICLNMPSAVVAAGLSFNLLTTAGVPVTNATAIPAFISTATVSHLVSQQLENLGLPVHAEPVQRMRRMLRLSTTDATAAIATASAAAVAATLTAAANTATGIATAALRSSLRDRYHTMGYQM